VAKEERFLATTTRSIVDTNRIPDLFSSVFLLPHKFLIWRSGFRFYILAGKDPETEDAILILCMYRTGMQTRANIGDQRANKCDYLWALVAIGG
jgi:hypothetical protein